MRITPPYRPYFQYNPSQVKLNFQLRISQESVEVENYLTRILLPWTTQAPLHAKISTSAKELGTMSKNSLRLDNLAIGNNVYIGNKD